MKNQLGAESIIKIWPYNLAYDILKKRNGKTVSYTDVYDVNIRALLDIVGNNKQTIEMHYKDGMTLDEIGNRFGVTKQTVSRTINHWLKNLSDDRCYRKIICSEDCHDEYEKLRRMAARSICDTVTSGLHDLEHMKNLGLIDEEEISKMLKRRGYTLASTETIEDTIDRDPEGKHYTDIADCGPLYNQVFIDTLNLSRSTLDSIMHYAQIRTIDELLDKTPNELMKLPNIGPRRIFEIKEVLKEAGYIWEKGENK